MKKIIREYERFPRFYGRAWYEFESQNIVCYPVPLNWIFSFARDVWWVLRRKQTLSYAELVYKENYNKAMASFGEHVERHLKLQKHHEAELTARMQATEDLLLRSQQAIGNNSKDDD
jgi:hypothetical protein